MGSLLPPDVCCMRALLSVPSSVVQAAAPGGRKRSWEEVAEAGPPRVRLTIEGCSLKEAALLLRFLYHPEQITADNMGRLGRPGRGGSCCFAASVGSVENCGTALAC